MLIYDRKVKIWCCTYNCFLFFCLLKSVSLHVNIYSSGSYIWIIWAKLGFWVWYPYPQNPIYDFFWWIIKFVNIEKQIQTNGSMPKVPGIFGTDITSAFPYEAIISIVWCIHTIGVWASYWVAWEHPRVHWFLGIFREHPLLGNVVFQCFDACQYMSWSLFAVLVFYELVQDVYRSSPLAYHEFMTMSMHVARFLLFISDGPHVH